MLEPIHFDQLRVRSHHLWYEQCLLLTAGDFAGGDYNTMTVGWGGLGTMWEKPLAMVVVRPVRYTYQFMEKFDTFTLSAFPTKYRRALGILGRRSGRNGDKIAAARLTPMAAWHVPAPTFSEADLVIECRKIYWSDFDPSHFLDPNIEAHYPNKDYHRIYFGEIIGIHGTAQYSLGPAEM
jgi:flavin reductase (DIM6/NTAB) family NADH-FMN oxidoreductase RutF